MTDERRVFISPHLDDAVFSCGQLIPASPAPVVVTIFAGMPADRDQLTMHDQACGFTNAGEAVDTRRAEDLEACHRLAANVVHLDHPDGQYGDPRPDVIALADELRLLLAGFASPVELVVPLGYPHHPDHALTTAACRFLAGEHRMLVYAEQPYAHNAPEWIAEAMELRGRDLAETHPAVATIDAKRHALAAYASQSHVFDLEHLLRPESYWRVWT